MAVTLHDKRGSAGVVKDFEMRLSWIIWVRPMGRPQRGLMRGRQRVRVRVGDAITEAEVRVMSVPT